MLLGTGVGLTPTDPALRPWLLSRGIQEPDAEPKSPGPNAAAAGPIALVGVVPDWIVDSGASSGVLGLRHVRESEGRVRPAIKPTVAIHAHN
jgi:hypothetical protein